MAVFPSRIQFLKDSDHVLFISVSPVPSIMLRSVERIPKLEAILNSHAAHQDRKSTRLNSSHANISYAVFCLKKNDIFMVPHSDISDSMLFTLLFLLAYLQRSPMTCRI